MSRTDKILELVGKERNGYTHAQIAKALQIPKSSLTLLLKELTGLNYLKMQPGNTYVLGPRLLVLAGRYMQNQDIVQIGRPILEQLVEDIDETAFLAVKNGSDVVYVSRVDCERPSVVSSVRIGQRGPLFGTAAGKAILAFQAERKIKRMILEMKENGSGLDDEAGDRLMEELERVRVMRLSYCREEFQEGIVSFGAPVFNIEGRVPAAITVAVPAFRNTPELEQRISERLDKAARDFSDELGFAGAFARDRKKSGGADSPPERKS
jgi:DNA-binding IclR family transcriptional regulator